MSIPVANMGIRAMLTIGTANRVTTYVRVSYLPECLKSLTATGLLFNLHDVRRLRFPT